MRNSPNFSLADEVIVRALEAGAFPSACLLVGRDERVLYRRAYGRLSIEDDAPLTAEQRHLLDLRRAVVYDAFYGQQYITAAMNEPAGE